MKEPAMQTIILSAVVGEDRRLVIDLPEDTQTGPVELIIRPAASNTTRETVRAKLLAAGALVTNLGIPDNIELVSDEELRRLGTMSPGARPSEELVAEDRGAKHTPTRSAVTLEDLRARRDEILRVAEENKAYNVRVFGSVARGEATAESDVDLLVSFREKATIWDAVGLGQELQELLGRTVNVVGDEDRDTRLLQRIRKDAVPLS